MFANEIGYDFGQCSKAPEFSYVALRLEVDVDPSGISPSLFTAYDFKCKYWIKMEKRDDGIIKFPNGGD
jgi:hypothetical protein